MDREMQKPKVGFSLTPGKGAVNPYKGFGPSIGARQANNSTSIDSPKDRKNEGIAIGQGRLEKAASAKDYENRFLNRLLTSDESKLVRISIVSKIFFTLAFLALFILCYALGYTTITTGNSFSYIAAGTSATCNATACDQSSLTFAMEQVFSFFYMKQLGVIGILGLIPTFMECVMYMSGWGWNKMVYDFMARGCNHLLWVAIVGVSCWFEMTLLFAIGERDIMIQIIMFFLTFGAFGNLYLFQKVNSAPFRSFQDLDDWIEKEKGDANEKSISGVNEYTKVEWSRPALATFPIGEFTAGWNKFAFEMDWYNLYMGTILYVGTIIIMGMSYGYSPTLIPWNVTVCFAFWFIWFFFLMITEILHALRIRYLSHTIHFDIITQFVFCIWTYFVVFMLGGVAYKTGVEA